MKNRDGFVSNSSSSSFILIGDRVAINTLTDKDVGPGLIATGKYLCDGIDIFTISSTGMLKFIQDHPGPFTVYKNAIVRDGDEPIDIDKPCTVVGGEQDQNSSWDIDRLFDHYEELIEEEAAVTMESAKKSLLDKYK